MAHFVGASLKKNFIRSLEQIEMLVKVLNDEQWDKGLSPFETPVNVAMHTVDCLDFFFREDREKKYKWGYRFGGGWWELPGEKKPSRKELVSYISRMKERIAAYFDRTRDEDLEKPCNDHSSMLDHYLYALRHTMHHQGGLNVLTVHAGIDFDGWGEEP